MAAAEAPITGPRTTTRYTFNNTQEAGHGPRRSFRRELRKTDEAVRNSTRGIPGRGLDDPGYVASAEDTEFEPEAQEASLRRPSTDQVGVLCSQVDGGRRGVRLRGPRHLAHSGSSYEQS